MRTRISFSVLTLMVATLSAVVTVHVAAQAQDGRAGQRPDKTVVRPAVFQAAGPTSGSIQSAVDEFRRQLGEPNNGNQPGPIAGGRREINWDGGGTGDTSMGPTPLTAFLNTRGAQMETPGTGFVQATPLGLATTFGNPTYANIFFWFSPVRLFSPIESNVTVVEFFVPGTNGSVPATTSGFGLVLADVNEPDGRTLRLRGSTVVEYLDVDGKLLYRGFVPASPGDRTFSFIGVAFGNPLLASVRIRAGDEKPGGDETVRGDIVMMDDFIYAEPIEIP